MKTGVSRYHVREDGDYGFVVSGLNRATIQVTFDLEQFQWYVQEEGQGWHNAFWLFSYRPLVAEIVRAVMAHWTPPEPRMERRWVLRAVGRGINTRVHQQWLRIKANLPQHYVDLERKIWSVNLHGGGSLTVAPQLWARPDLIEDLFRYRAARLAIAFHDVGELPTFDWRASYAINGKPYRALNLTLDHLPGRLEHLPRELNRVKLERPITDRLELGCLLLYSTTGYFHTDRQTHLHLFMHARHADLKRAIQMTGAYQERGVSTARFNDLRAMVQMAADYPRPHSGNIVGLIERSIDYHREMRDAARREDAALLEDTTPVALPPIPLPDHPDIRFLATCGEIRSEGMEMGHCVGRPEMHYLSDALNGHSFIFAVLHNGSRVTVEVGDAGNVRQANGIENVENPACDWARKQLERWGRGFPRQTPTAEDFTRMIAAGERYVLPEIAAVVEPAPLYPIYQDVEWEIPF